MPIEPNLTQPTTETLPASAIENEIPTYRAISALAVFSLICGVLAVLSFAHGSFLISAAAAIVLGILADGQLDQPTRPAQAVHPAVAATVALLEADLAEPWRLDDLAEAVNLDPAYLSRLFRRHTGLSPLGFLARLRAERAATLLVHTTLPAARVGAAVGWDDPTYFARRFRSLVGSTPSEYRARS